MFTKILFPNSPEKIRSEREIYTSNYKREFDTEKRKVSQPFSEYSTNRIHKPTHNVSDKRRTDYENRTPSYGYKQDKGKYDDYDMAHVSTRVLSPQKHTSKQDRNYSSTVIKMRNDPTVNEQGWSVNKQSLGLAHSDIGDAFKKREKELLTEISNLHSDLKKYRDMNRELKERFSKTTSADSRRFTFQPDGNIDKSRDKPDIVDDFREKYHSVERSNERLQKEVHRMKAEVDGSKDVRESTKESDSKKLHYKQLELKAEDLKKTIAYLQQRLDKEKEYRNSFKKDNFKDLYKQEYDTNNNLRRENEKLRELNENYARGHNKIVEELNALKIKGRYETSKLSSLRMAYESEIEENSILLEKIEHYKKVLKIYGYEPDGKSNLPQGNSRLEQTTKYKGYEQNSNYKTNDVHKLNSLFSNVRINDSENPKVTEGTPSLFKNPDQIYDSKFNQKNSEVQKANPYPQQSNLQYSNLDEETMGHKFAGLNSMSDRHIEEANNPQKVQSKVDTESIVSGILESKHSLDQTSLYNRGNRLNNELQGNFIQSYNNSYAVQKNPANDFRNEYSIAESQVKNIFYAPLNNTTTDLAHSFAEKPRNVIIQPQRYENLDCDFDSFGGVNARRQTKTSVQPSIKRI